ncbi:MAG: DNA polymerase III subunit delta [Ignavibacteria bacterium]|jgi:DNA polymerase-3 subunit delta
MAKIKAPSILDVLPSVNKGNLKPVYYFFGEDYYLLQNTLKAVEKSASQFITSDFDKETFYGEDKGLDDILSFASAFPFGSEKKLIIVKQFEKVKDKKALKEYAASPVDFTIIVFIHDGIISNLGTEPFKTLAQQNFIFESKELKGKNLLKWVTSYIEKNGKIITEENAQMLMDISGESRTMLENQLEKIFTFMNEEREITFEHIQALSTKLKQYSIFDLQNAIGRREGDKAIKIAYNLLDNGAEPVFIIAMLTRYFTGISRVGELTRMNMAPPQAAKIVGTHQFFYKDYQQARMNYSDENLANIFRALLKADLSIKTTSADFKNVVTVLLSEIIA